MSYRGLNIEGEDESWDFGSGAGFYVNATQPKWKNYRSAPGGTRHIVGALRQAAFLLVLPLPIEGSSQRHAHTCWTWLIPCGQYQPLKRPYTSAGCMSTSLRSCQPCFSTSQSSTPRR